MMFIKHFLYFLQTVTQILMKFGPYIHLSKVFQVWSNEVCMTYVYLTMLISFLVVTEHVYLHVLLYVTMEFHIIDFFASNQ